MNLFNASAGEILNALGGVVYAVDADGIVVCAGGSEWDTFPAQTGAVLPASAVLGRNLFDLIEGADVRTAYRAIHDRVVSGSTHLAFDYRCDAPDRERLMRMALGPILVGGEVVGVLYQSTIVSSLSRVPLAYLANDEALRRYQASAALPIVLVCAWCADVSTVAGEWFKPDEYYRRGGAADVQLSHGVCTTCRTTVIAPLLEPV